MGATKGITRKWKRYARLYALQALMNQLFGTAVEQQRYDWAESIIARLERIDIEMFEAFEKLEGK